VRRLILLLALLMPLPLAAQESAVVQVELLPETVRVGESTRLHVTVLGPTWFSKPPVFPSFEIPNAVVRLPPDSSHPTAGQVNGERWNGISRYYEVYPLMPASYAIGGQSIRVTVANPGGDPIVVDVAIPELTLAATVPAGAEGLDPYIAGQALTLTREIEGADPASLMSGDAVVIRTVAEIDGLPVIFLPPLNPELDLEGVSAYPDEPLVEDGETGRRTEKLTLIFTAGGEFRLPGIELDWWDVNAEQARTVSVPELVFTVAGPPVPVEETAEPPVERDWKALLLQIAGITLLAYLAWRFASWLVLRAKQRAAEIQASEQYAFNQILLASAGGDTRKTYKAFLAWLDRLEPRMDAYHFIHEFGDKALGSAFNTLSEHVYSDAMRDAKLPSFVHSLGKARKKYLNQVSTSTQSQVPPLNP
jgi:hypothetical protein